jgi:hypothetical protein
MSQSNERQEPSPESNAPTVGPKEAAIKPSKVTKGFPLMAAKLWRPDHCWCQPAAVVD